MALRINIVPTSGAGQGKYRAVLQTDRRMSFESFLQKAEEATTIRSIPAIIPSIEGWAKVYGYNNIIIDDEDDPYWNGFQVI